MATLFTFCPLCDELDECTKLRPVRKGWTRLICSNGHVFEEKKEGTR